jgi:hypothetical protein
MGLKDHAAKPSFVSPALHFVNEANMARIDLASICNDSLKPSAHREIEKVQLSPLRVAGFAVAIKAY